MNVLIRNKPLFGTVDVISSKSVSHRSLIAAALAVGTSEINGLLDALDLDATKHALESLGARFEARFVTGQAMRQVNKIIDCNESGSTLRMMIPVAMLLDQVFVFTGRNRLTKRPLDVYRDAFKPFGYHFETLSKETLPLSVKGPLKAGRYVLRGDVSSQFVSGLLFALPLLEGDSIIELTTPLESKGYVDLTISTLRRFGVEVREEGQMYLIEGKQRYQPQTLKVEGDYSQAAFFFVAGTIGQEICLTNLDPESIQGDRAIVRIINEMGGDIQYDQKATAFVVKPRRTRGITIDLKDIPDLGPALMVLAALSEGTTVFINTERLRLKESDRVQAMADVLNAFGVQVEMDGDTLRITGVNALQGHVTIDSANDHRIVMAAAMAAIRANGPVMINGAEAIRKSYPTFFDDYQTLGGDFDASN